MTALSGIFTYTQANGTYGYPNGSSRFDGVEGNYEIEFSAASGDLWVAVKPSLGTMDIVTAADLAAGTLPGEQQFMIREGACATIYVPDGLSVGVACAEATADSVYSISCREL